jgi:hypothetical protein
MWSILLLGFLLGMRHSLDADHLAAVASLATRNRSTRESVDLGLSWGIGHALPLFLIGAAVLLAETVIPEAFARLLEVAVGVMLVLLGGDVLRRMITRRVHFHIHRHPDGLRHFHAHSHAGEEQPHDAARHEHPHRISLRALLVGMVHGMAGSAALVLLTVETLHSVVLGLVYIALFSIGALAGMAVLSALITMPLRYAATRMAVFFHGLQVVIGTGTVVLGCVMIYRFLAL